MTTYFFSQTGLPNKTIQEDLSSDGSFAKAGESGFTLTKGEIKVTKLFEPSTFRKIPTNNEGEASSEEENEFYKKALETSLI